MGPETKSVLERGRCHIQQTGVVVRNPQMTHGKRRETWPVGKVMPGK